MNGTKKTNKENPIVVEPIDVRMFNVDVVGMDSSPLLMNKQSDAVRENLKAYTEGKVRGKKIRLSLEDEVAGKIHYTEDGDVGFPAKGFEKGMIEVAPYLNLYKKTIRGAVKVMGNIVPIKYKKQIVNKVMGRTAGRNRTPKEIWRPEFTDWSCKLTIRYNAAIISAEQIVNLLNWAGFHQGLGDWRPECSGSYGQYKVKMGK